MPYDGALGDRPRHGEHRAVASGRLVDGVHGATRRGRLDDNHDASQRGDDAVARWESPPRGGGTERRLRHEHTRARHLAPQPVVAARVDDVEAGGHDADRRRPTAVDGAAMGGSVDARRQPADHRHAGRGQLGAEPVGDVPPVARAPARADHGRCGANAEVGRIAQDIEHAWRVGVVDERGRPRGVAGQQHGDAGVDVACQFGVRVDTAGGVAPAPKQLIDPQPLRARGGERGVGDEAPARDLVPHIVGIGASQKEAESGRADLGQPAEGDHRGPLVARHDAYRWWRPDNG